MMRMVSLWDIGGRGGRMRMLGALGCGRCEDVRGLDSRMRIRTAASHCEGVPRWFGGAMGGCVR
jgi:hypothetical protein